MKKKIKLTLIVLLVALIVIQFFPVDTTPPDYDTNQSFGSYIDNSTDEYKLLKNACFDCHSYETTYPWYTRVQPVGWWLRGHIKGGRKNVNFSLWSTLSSEEQGDMLRECAEEIEEKHMPLGSYTWMHDEAKLTDAERESLSIWLRNRTP